MHVIEYLLPGKAETNEAVWNTERWFITDEKEALKKITDRISVDADKLMDGFKFSNHCNDFSVRQGVTPTEIAESWFDHIFLSYKHLHDDRHNKTQYFCKAGRPLKSS